MFDNKKRFIINDYGRKFAFSSFLPGIGGKRGIPLWCFYVNRGQAVAGFGLQDKNHAIMEFFPAHQAYQFVKSVGFRTFLKVDGIYYEPFGTEHENQQMFIGMNELEIEEQWEEKLQVNVLYYTLPNESLAGLVRRVTITNTDSTEHTIQILDGMPAIIPYGVNLATIKEMGQTCKAWMQVEDVENGLPYYKVRSSMEDSIDVREVKAGHFYFAVTESGERLPVIVDPQIIFEYDTALARAVGFERKNISQLLKEPQVTENSFPCGFFGKEVILLPGQSIQIYEIAGQAKTEEELEAFSLKCNRNYFEQKYAEAAALTDALCSGIHTKTASLAFDAYCRQTYLDNILRGGYPVLLGKDKVFYLYSRKHGDMERDYNFFSMQPEYYSQGNANFRDINQNRRSDVLFCPYVKNENIKTFYNLIQLDGYNPLSVQQVTYRLLQEKVEELSTWLTDENAFRNFVQNEFTPGSLLTFVQKTQVVPDEQLEEFLNEVMDRSYGGVNADFGEGFWTDHWTYNLDLVETYLSVYPETEKWLLFEDSSYTYFDSGVFVNPRNKRYEETARGIRQYKTLDRERKKHLTGHTVCTDFGRGEVYRTTLMEKLLLLCAVKIATLDPCGMGIEMEAGKPGWYDALNGLPGILGSSVAESCELWRMLEFVRRKLEEYSQEVQGLRIACEIKTLIFELDQVMPLNWEGISTWNAVNDVKERYREKTAEGLSGETELLDGGILTAILDKWIEILNKGILQAEKCGNGICCTYFYYEVTSYEKRKDEIIPLEFCRHNLPHFLEGPVRWLKLPVPIDEKRKLYQKIKSSDLYDKKLSMYKVSGSLRDAPFEAGRATAFTPGWLENESIWLHMEYKYYLELLKSGLYKEFFADFKHGLIPFMDEEFYGRSTLENSSFIASSANPNSRIHGKGFVARLSGSTAEFLQIWQIMMFGENPFRMQKGSMVLVFEPTVPQYLIPENLSLECTFLGKTTVRYQFSGKRDFIPAHYVLSRQEIHYRNGQRETILDRVFPAETALKIRNGEALEILVDVI